MIFYVFAFLIGVIVAKIVIKWMQSPFEQFGISEEQKPNPFIASEYLDRMEKTGLEVLEQKEQIERIIILWWGFDGLRLNEDGTLEWISRKKPDPFNQDVFYQPQQRISLFRTIPYAAFDDMCQSTQAQIDYLMAQNTFLQMQAANMAQNVQIANGINNLNAQCFSQNICF